MKGLKLINRISIFLLWLAAAFFVVGGTLFAILNPGFVPYALFFSFVMVFISIPFTLISLVKAYRYGIVSWSYVAFSIVASSFAGLGWCVIPFALRRDMLQFLEEQAVAGETAGFD